MKNSLKTFFSYSLLFLMITFLLGSCNDSASRNETAFNSIEEDHNSLTSVLDTKSVETLREDTNVLVTVDTENISEETKEEYVFLTDDRSDPLENSKKPAEHVALVDKNMKIYWRGEAEDPTSGVTVDIIEIRRKSEGGSEILESVFRDPNQDGIVIGKIKNKKVDGLEYYNIVIRVNGDTPQTYVIDPKIKMVP